MIAALLCLIGDMNSIYLPQEPTEQTQLQNLYTTALNDYKSTYPWTAYIYNTLVYYLNPYYYFYNSVINYFDDLNAKELIYSSYQTRYLSKTNVNILKLFCKI